MGWAARFLTAASFLAAGALFAPEALLGGSGRSGAGVAAARLAHILSFATAWGAALWVTFIGGIVMFKYLPRHQFGNLQGKMFPAYFMLISVCSAISVAAFAYLHPWKTASTIERYQLGFLIAALGFDLSNLLVFTPITIERAGRVFAMKYVPICRPLGHLIYCNTDFIVYYLLCCFEIVLVSCGGSRMKEEGRRSGRSCQSNPVWYLWQSLLFCRNRNSCFISFLLSHSYVRKLCNSIAFIFVLLF